MPNYRRNIVPGGTYFFTQVTYQRHAWLCSDIARSTLRTAINKVRKKYPFSIDALVLQPDHFHCILTLPEGDRNYSTRLRLIKTYVTKHCADKLNIKAEITESRQNKKEGNLWQRRFWEHTIKDEEDYARHCDYIHYNPVKHGLCKVPQQWQFSTIHQFIEKDIYPQNWRVDEIPDIPEDPRYE